MTTSGNRGLILFVEDEPGITSVFSMLLELEGYRVVVADDGLAGLALLRREKPDLVITDYMMPRMNGLEMIREIRADPVYSTIAILLISAAPPPLAALTGQPDLFLRKPIGSTQLLDTIEQLLSAPGTPAS